MVLQVVYFTGYCLERRTLAECTHFSQLFYFLKAKIRGVHKSLYHCYGNQWSGKYVAS